MKKIGSPNKYPLQETNIRYKTGMKWAQFEIKASPNNRRSPDNSIFAQTGFVRIESITVPCTRRDIHHAH